MQCKLNQYAGNRTQLILHLCVSVMQCAFLSMVLKKLITVYDVLHCKSSIMVDFILIYTFSLF